MHIGIDARLINQTGVGRYTKNLIDNLAKIDKKNQYILFLRKQEYNFLSLPAKNFEKKLADFRWHSFEEQIKFPKILEKENLDLVHFPYFSVPLFYKGKFIVTIHDLIIDHFDTGRATTLPLPIYKIKRLGYKKILASAIKNAVKIISVSNATKQEIIDHYKVDPNKIEVIYEAPHRMVRGEAPQLNGNYILYVGNAYPHKNLDRLIEACKDFKLILAGPKDYFYSKIKPEKNLLIKNNLSDEDLSSLYQNAKVLVLPSLMEGFGLTILEAMQYNLPIAASRIPSIQEIAGNSINYFDPNDPKDIKNVIIKTLNSKPKDYTKILSQFNWKKTAYETLKLYENCLKIK